MTRFTRDDEVFKSETPFRDEYIPETLTERENELDEYTNALRPIIKGEPPKNIFIYGTTGVGKTVSTKFLLDDLSQQCKKYDDLKLTTVNISCRESTTSYRLASQITNKLNDIRGVKKIATNGYPKHEMYSMMHAAMDDVGGTILIILDEIDNLSDDELLYLIPRARSNGEVKSCSPAIVGISNDFQYKQGLSSDVRGTLCDEEIFFDPYTTEQLESILERRADAAFHPDVVGDGVIPLCAVLSSRETGDARQALRLLYKSGEVARGSDTDSNKIHVEDVREAFEILQESRVKNGVKGFTVHSHLVILSLVHHTVNGKRSVRTRKIHDVYSQLAEEVNVDPLVWRRMIDHMQDLQKYGIVISDRKNKGSNSGRYDLYELCADMQVILDSLCDVPIVDSLAEQYLDRF